jgi:DNA repair exonuclease SbcCD nuclease subunit
VSQRILVVGDPHLKISTLETARKFLVWFADVIKTEKPDSTIVMGDLFDTHSVVRVEILWLWAEFMKAHANQRVTCLVGNHDQAAPGSKEHSLVALSAWARIIDEPTEFNGMAFIPYVHTKEAFAEALSKLKSKNDYLFCHQTFQGAQYENGFYDPNGFPLELVKDFKQVISGHVHKLQKLGNVFYVGSPYWANFADSGEQKGLWIFDAERGVFEKAIPSPLPKFVSLKFTEAESIFEYFKSASPTDNYKVVFLSGRSSVQAVIDSKEFKSLKKAFKITWVPEFTDSVNREVRIAENTSKEGMLEVYVNTLLTTDLDKSRLLSLTKRVLADSLAVK